MSMNLGINLVEVDGATPSIQGAPTSVAGFVIRAQRGVPGAVRQISNFTQFTDYFGGYVADGNVDGTQTSYVGAYAIRGFFDNGGTLAYVTRVVATDAVPAPAGGAAVTPASPARATLSVLSNGAAAALTLQAAFRGQTDPGAWGNSIAVSVAPNPNLDSSFDLTIVSQSTGKVLETWSKLVIGGAPQRDPSILNDPNTGSRYVKVMAGQLAAWKGGAPYAVGAMVVNDKRAYVATKDGTSAIAGPSGATPGPDNQVAWTAVPAWQMNHSYNPNDSVTNGGHTYTTKQGGMSAASGGPTGAGNGIVDNKVTWDIVATPGWQPSTDYALGAYVSNATGIYQATAGGKSAPAGPTPDALGDNTVQWALVPPANPPTWRSGASYSTGDHVVSGTLLYRATTSGTSGGTAPTGSTAADDGGVKWSAVVTGNTPLAGGSDDNLSSTTVQTLDSALADVFATPSLLDPYPISLLACPETANTDVVKAALGYAAGRGDCMFVGHVPDYGSSPLSAAKSYGKSLQGEKVYGAVYAPYLQVVDPIGSQIWIPPTGHVLGVYARTDQQRGVWKAPAGNAAIVANALDVRAMLNDTDFTDLVKNGSVNLIRPIQGAGIVVDSARTLSTSTLWLYANVRLLFNYVKTSLRLGLRWVVEEPNDTALWNKVKFNSVTPFLMGLWRRGAFGPGAPKDVFLIKVDAENNPPANIQQGILDIEVYFYPSRPAETIVITVGQKDGAATASEG